MNGPVPIKNLSEGNPMSHEATAKLNASAILGKVPAVTLAFWVIKIFATTLGETGGDAVTTVTAASLPNLR